MTQPYRYEVGLIRTDRGLFIDKGNQVFDVRHPDYGCGGAKADGVTDDTEAVQAAFDDAAANGGGIIRFPSGTTLCEGIKPGGNGNIVIQGGGRGRLTDGTTVVQSVTGATVFDFDTGSFRNVVFRDLTIRGNGGAGHGVHFRSTLTSNPFGIKFENVVVDECGGKGIYDEKGMFESQFVNVMTSNNGGDHIDISGGPALLFSGCRIWLLQDNTIGYRVRSGTGTTFVSCNGVTLTGGGSGVEMIRLGDSQRATGTIIGCNFEDINGTGINLLNGSVVDLLGATAFRPQTIANFVALQFAGPSSAIQYGFISPTVFFAVPSGGGSYKNDQPLHSTLNTLRMYSAHKDVQQFYNDTSATVEVIEGPFTYMEMDEVADVDQPDANKARIYFRDTGGTTEMRVRFRNNNRPLLRDVARATYTPTNVTTDRSFDANSTTVEELADVLGTLIADMQADGYLG